MQVSDQQQRQKGCPNLDAQRVFARADEGFDLEVLLERFEKEFDLPVISDDTTFRLASIRTVGILAGR